MFGRTVRRALGAMSVGVLVAGAVSIDTSSAGATPAAGTLPALRTAYAMLTVAAHDEVFVGGDGGLVVVPSGGTGTPAAIAGATTHVSALAQSVDGATLWVGSSDGTLMSIDAADPMTGTKQTYTPPKAVGCVTSVAVAGDGRVWFGFGCGKPAGIGVLDPTAGTWTTTVADTLFQRALVAPVVLAADPTTGNTLVVSEDGYTARPALTATLDVSQSPASVVSKVTNVAGASSLAVAPDGASVIIGRGNRYPVRYSTAALTDASARTVLDGNELDPGQASAVVALSSTGDYLGAAGQSGPVTYGPLPDASTWVRMCDGGQTTALAWSGTTLLTAHPTGSSVELDRCDSATTPQSVVTTDVPLNGLHAGEKFSFPVHLFNHGEPVPGATMTVARIDDKGTHALASVVTRTDGSASVTDTVPREGSVAYTVAYAGDSTHEPASARRDTYAYRHTSVLTMNASRAVRLDAPATITARLVDADASRPVTSRTLRVIRIDASGRHGVKSVVTDAKGLVRVQDHPHVGGFVTYDVVFDGDAGYARSSATKQIVVSRPVPTLTVTRAHSVVEYGAVATVRIHLGRTSGRMIRVVAHPHNGYPRQVAYRRVDAHGNLTVSTRVSKRTTITAEYAGDYRHAPRSASAVQLVETGVTMTMGDDRGTTSAGVHLYRTTDWFTLIAAVHPRRYDVCLYFEGSYLKDGAWHSVGRSACQRTNYPGRSVVYFNAPKAGAGAVTYAFHAYYRGDVDNVAAASPWVYAKVT